MSQICPLCGGANCHSIPNYADDFIRYECLVFDRKVRIAMPFGAGSNNQRRKMYNLIFEHMIQYPYYGTNTYWCFFYEPSYRAKDTDDPCKINLAEVQYPKTLSDRIDRILMNLFRINPEFGHVFSLEQQMARAFFSETEQEDKSFGFASIMIELGYLKEYTGNACAISAKGWQRIEEIQRNHSEKRQGFIAMAFRKETESIRNSFREALQRCGYMAMAIDEKEHNNQIVPEIFHEIDNSKFLVMDVTYPNFGAYYEAGYALGKGKQVIICCSKESFEDPTKTRPHFDIQQKSMVIWETEEELVSRLEKRIAATIKP